MEQSSANYGHFTDEGKAHKQFSLSFSLTAKYFVLNVTF